MAQVKIPARDIIVEVESSTPDEWLPVEHLSSVTPDRSANEAVADTTDYDSQGVYEQLIMQRGATLTLEGQEIKDDSTGELPPGRARLEELAGEDKVGHASLGRIRFRHPMDDNWRVWTCTVTLGASGGAVNDVSAWAVTITKSGPTTTTPVDSGSGT